MVGPAGGAGHAWRHRTVDRTRGPLERWKRDPALVDEAHRHGRRVHRHAFWPAHRHGPAAARHAAMGLLLALHLGVVFALFITMPHEFVHTAYRYAALVRYARAADGGA